MVAEVRGVAPVAYARWVADKRREIAAADAASQRARAAQSGTR
jgi:hypothetical protein